MPHQHLDKHRVAAARLLGCCWLLVALLSACAVRDPILEPVNTRPYRFETDRIAFANQLEDLYQIDPAAGTTKILGSNPDATYVQHCFVLSRSVRQFYEFARFDPSRPRIDDDGYRKLVEEVVAGDLREEHPPARRVVIPGYDNLYEFSKDKETLLKKSLGSRIESFFQRGNWRMVFPFTRKSKRQIADTLFQEVHADRPPVVHITHLVILPDYDVNHAMVLYAADRGPDGIRFTAYDPNNPAKPATLKFDLASQNFTLPPSNYYAGGPVNVYEVYNSAFY
jgi:hypothetical protein